MDEKDAKSGGDATLKKRKLSDASDMNLEGDKPPKKTQRKSQENADSAPAQCNGDDVMVISDDEDSNSKNGAVNGKDQETKKEDCDLKKETKNEQDSNNTQGVKPEGEMKKEVVAGGGGDNKSIVRNSLKLKQLAKKP